MVEKVLIPENSRACFRWLLIPGAPAAGMTGRAVVLILASGLKGVYDDVCFLVYGKKTII